MVVKPKSRGYVRLRSADPDDMPLVSPHLLKDPDDMATMIAGQRFFLRAFQTGPLGERDREVIAARTRPTSATRRWPTHCRRFVKTNYHPAGTARMGADGDRMAVLDRGMRVRGIDNLRVCRHVGRARTSTPATRPRRR